MANFFSDLLNPYNLQVFILVGVNALLALSVWLPLSAGQLSLGGAGFMAVGAYTAAIMTLHLETPYIVSILVGTAAGGVVAFLLGLPVLRLSGVYLAIATLGFGEMVRITALNLRITNGALGLSGLPNIVDEIMFWLEDTGLLPYGETWMGQESDTMAHIIVILMLLLILAACVYVLISQTRSRIGRAIAAIQIDELAAQAMGIDITRYKLLVFTQSGLLAGLAGGLYAHLSYFIGPSDFGFSRAIEMLLFTVLGGMNTIVGPLLGATVITWLPEILRWSPSHRAILYGFILLVTISFAPQGLVTPKVVARVTKAFRSRRRTTGEAPLGERINPK